VAKILRMEKAMVGEHLRRAERRSFGNLLALRLNSNLGFLGPAELSQSQLHGWWARPDSPVWRDL
jgi:hypothetical protein